MCGTIRNYTQDDEWDASWGTYPQTGCRPIPHLELARHVPFGVPDRFQANQAMKKKQIKIGNSILTNLTYHHWCQ